MNIEATIAKELQVKPSQVQAAVKLLDDGDTVPFISRYRKEVTGNLDDTQLRDLEERLHYLRELEDRKQTVIKTIQEQGKLTDELKKSIIETDNKATLEDIYLPYKPKRRTKGQIAIEAGLEPLADAIFNDPSLTPEKAAEDFITDDIKDTKQALEGARYILMERFAENAALVGELREYLWQHGVIESAVIKEKEDPKFKDYFQYTEALNKIPSHRALALFRGRNDGILRVTTTLQDQEHQTCQDKIALIHGIKNNKRPGDIWLLETVSWTWKIKLFTKLETDLMLRLREQADEEAIGVFATNLKHLLMTAPAGSKVTMGLDPGLRTGVKVVVIDGTGKLLEYTTIFPHAPRNQWNDSLITLGKLCQKHNVSLISIGNGTASRETDKLAAELIKYLASAKTGSSASAQGAAKLTKIVVSEAGASVYSASKSAANEFPDLDVTFRGAVSIARRLQDPLAELVKIEPKSIGVGQYQHDVNQVKLSKSLHGVTEDCVNAVGVDVNTASEPLLTVVAGMNSSIAKNIVAYRDEHGPFKERKALQKVPRLGDKAFQQAAGFLRIINGKNPLDASAVHPEAYPLVKKILEKSDKPIQEIMGNASFVNHLQVDDYIDDQFGAPTVKDIFQELVKPGRDPRPEFKAAEFKEGVETLKDLKEDMILEGVVTNVANFGAFIDVGVHQDGLVHMSEMADRFVKDANEIVKVGDIVKVRVLSVDLERKRIGLSLRLQASGPKQPKQSRDDKPQHQREKQQAGRPQQQRNQSPQRNSAPPKNNSLLEALMKAKGK